MNIRDLKIVPISNNLERSAQAIAESRCDILYYWEAGSDALNYFLPFRRLAPVQCASHGSQITSGIHNLDYFFSSQWMEVAGAQQHYTEVLWRANSLLICQPRLPAQPPATRQRFGLPETATLYACLQNPLKMHPDFDALIAGVLRGDARGVLVALRGNSLEIERQLRARFERTMPDVRDRIIFLSQQTFPAYCQLLQMSDVVLDPLHFGHGSSAYDVFSFDLPFVTLPTAINVGRVGAAFYNRLGLGHFVAESAAAYIEQATRLGRDEEYRRHTREAIRAASDVLFNDHTVVSEHERFFAEIAQNVE